MKEQELGVADVSVRESIDLLTPEPTIPMKL